MVDKVGPAPDTTQTAMKRLACLGNAADARHVRRRSAVARRRRPTPRSGTPSAPGSSCALDPTLQVPPRPRPGGRLHAHPRGRARRGPPPARPGAPGAPARGGARRAVFDLVSQLNRGVALITDPGEQARAVPVQRTGREEGQGRDRLRVGARLPGAGRGAPAHRPLAHELRRHVRALPRARRVRVPDRPVHAGRRAVRPAPRQRARAPRSHLRLSPAHGPLPGVGQVHRGCLSSCLVALQLLGLTFPESDAEIQAARPRPSSPRSPVHLAGRADRRSRRRPRDHRIAIRAR